MNNHDRENFEFLMSLKTDEDWLAWAEFCSEDDFVYAMELIRTAVAECLVQELELDEAEQAEEGLDCTQALEIINRVKKESL